MVKALHKLPKFEGVTKIQNLCFYFEYVFQSFYGSKNTYEDNYRKTFEICLFPTENLECEIFTNF